MKQELQQLLYDAFPVLFKAKLDGLGPNKTCMFWGIDTGDGWFQLIWDLCMDITNYQKDHPEIFNDIEMGPIQAEQVKEKFGGLRFYTNYGDDKVYEFIGKAEKRSYETCEICGEPGKPSGWGWITTLCPKHEEESRTKNKRQMKEDMEAMKTMPPA